MQQPPHPNHNHNKKFKPPQKNSSFTYVLIFALLLTLSYYMFSPGQSGGDTRATEIPISQMVKEYNDGFYSELEIKNGKIFAVTNTGQRVLAYRPEGEGITQLGLNNPDIETPVRVISTETSTFWINMIASWLPILLFIALIVFMAKQLGKGANSAFSFGKSR